MKHLLITTIAAVVLVGCGPSVDIWEAAATGNIETVKQHLAAGWDVDAEDNYKTTPLQFAAQGGHKKIVELLIAEGADVNVNEDGNSPLHIAANREIAELLITNGADVNAKKGFGSTPLHSALFVKRKEIAKLLIAEGADVNAKSEEGTTPLHLAATSGHNEIAELLIAKGADVNANKVYGETPLDSARFHSETADLLRKHGGKTGAELKAEGK